MVVFAFCLFLGENSILETRKLKSEIKELNAKLKECKLSTDNVKTQNATLTNSTYEETEAYLRRQHQLKKDNEDVFRIVYQKKENND
jgi:cell division protein FtsB